MRKFLLLFALFILVFTACTSQAAGLTGKWKLVSYGPADSMTAAVRDAEATLTFSEDGSVTGSGGCNSLGGSYKVSDEEIEFSEITSTLMACEADRMAQESAVTHVLSGTANFEIEDQTLTISNDNIGLMFISVPVE